MGKTECSQDVFLKPGGWIEKPGTRKRCSRNDELSLIKLRKDLSKSKALFGHQFRKRFQHLRSED